MGNFLRIRDLVKFSLLDENLMKVRDDFYQATNNGQSQQGLFARIAATHSGKITRNNGFYLPQKMRDGAKSFTDNYQKPVLLHHEDHRDPIGRVVEAQYVDTSGAIRDKLQEMDGLVVKDRFGKEKGRITDKMMADFVDGRMPYGMAVDFVHTYLRDSLLEDKDYEGLGHIQILVNITDKDSIEKFLDGRYMTGSVGATTDRAVCSVCKQDWTDAGQCEHRPGAIYDGAKCFIIAGKLMYDEYSVVNVPADRHSKVLELNYNGQATLVDFADEYSKKVKEVQLEFPQYDITRKEEGYMSDKNVKTVKVEDTTTVTTPEENPETVQDSSTEGATEAVSEETQDEQVQDSATEAKPEEETAGGEIEVADGTTEEKPLDGLISKVLDSASLEADEAETLYDALWAEAEAGFAEDEFSLEDLGVEKLEDAKLSTEKRKKLAKSTFCGPGCSFPVPDAAHVSAARRLIDKYEGEGNKDSIMACVERKAKAMGVDSKKKEKKTEEEVQDAMNHARMMHMVLSTIEENHYYSGEESTLTDDEKGQLATILKRLASLVGKDSFNSALQAEALVDETEAEKALLDEIEKNEELVGDLRDQVSALRAEYNSLYGDLETVENSLAEAKTSTRNAKEAHAKVLMALSDQNAEGKEWSKVADNELDAELNVLKDKVDMKQITDKLGDGMTRNPDGNIEDPTVVHENKNQKRIVTDEQMAGVEERWHYLAFTKGQTVADAWLKSLNLEGRVLKDSVEATATTNSDDTSNED